MTLSSPGVARIEVDGDGATPRTYRGVTIAAEHEIDLWGLRPDTEYRWSAGQLGGTLSTGSLPESLAAAAIEVTGSAAFDAVVMPLSWQGRHSTI